MTYQAIERQRRRILGRRFSLLKRRDHTLADAEELRAEREPDWEDAAALATTAGLLETLGETDRDDLVRLDEALARMQRGTYGECAVCAGPIGEDRLQAIPEADRCARCAS